MKKVPEVGDLIRVNPAFKEEWWRKICKTAQFPDEGEVLEVKKVEKHSKDYIYISWSSDLGLIIDENGRCVQSPIFYSDNEVFIIVKNCASVDNASNDATGEGVYCSCSGAGKENWACGERFMVCTDCGKEQL